jgi:hypothetical protein
MKKPQRVIWRTLVAALGGLLVSGFIGCGSKKPCIDKSKPELEQCQTDIDGKQKEINQLKLQLAQALANPGSIKVDPSVLMIDGKHLMPKLREGNLSQDQVVKTIRLNKRILKACYERAMKKNTNLRRQKITLTLAFKVQPTGVPNNISVKPNYDGRMIDCMKKAIKRWRFPQFSGQSVGVESPLTLTPKHN